MANPTQFAAAVLKGIGAPVTPHNIAGFIGWSKAEGPLASSNWQRHNPLNTTEGTGAVGGAFNSAGVRTYPNVQAGVHATVITLKNGNYPGILRAFRTNNVGSLAGAIGNSPWGTSGSLAAQTIRDTLGQHFNVPSGSSSLGAPTSGQGGGQRFRTTPGQTTRTTRQVFNQNAYQQAKARTVVGNLIASTPNPYKAVEAKTGLGSAPNPLISTGLLTPGAMPSPQDFMHAQTTLQHIAGQRLAPHIGAQAGLANKAVTDAANAGAGRDAQKLLNMLHNVVGAQYNQANHDAVSEHHGQIRSQGTDCSGLISWLMGPNGLGIWSTSQATPGIPSAPGIQPGRGRLITIYNNRQAGNAGHVFIRIGNQYFASEGGGVGIHQLPMSEVRNYLQHGSDGGTYQALHPRGL